MSYKHPIISTPVGGIPEIIENGRNGLLVTPGDTKAIANAIKFYIVNKDKISEHGKYAFEIVKDFFPEKVFSDLNEIYQTLLVQDI